MLGLRPGEMLGLRWEDVDLDGGVLRVRVSLKQPDGKPVLADLKTERSKRTLEMPAAVRSVLRALQRQQAADRLAIGVTAYAGHGLVFARADGRPESRGEVLARFKEVTKTAGIGPDWTLRDLRHTFVSVLSDAGTDIEAIADAAGHVNSVVTKTTYRHQIADKISSAAVAMDGVFGQADGAS